MSASPSVLPESIAKAPDGAPRARLLHDAARSLMTDPAAAAAVAATAAADGDRDGTHAAAALLSVALAEARMAQENDAPEGVALTDAVAAALAARDASAQSRSPAWSGSAAGCASRGNSSPAHPAPCW